VKKGCNRGQQQPQPHESQLSQHELQPHEFEFELHEGQPPSAAALHDGQELDPPSVACTLPLIAPFPLL
jgi:hypothetical protein